MLKEEVCCRSSFINFSAKPKERPLNWHLRRAWINDLQVWRSSGRMIKTGVLQQSSNTRKGHIKPPSRIHSGISTNLAVIWKRKLFVYVKTGILKSRGTETHPDWRVALKTPLPVGISPEAGEIVAVVLGFSTIVWIRIYWITGFAGFYFIEGATPSGDKSRK